MLTASGCDPNAIPKQKLERYKRENWHKNEVISDTGKTFTIYQRNEGSWKALHEIFDRESDKVYTRVEEKAERAEEVMFYTTMSTTGWIFLDENDRVIDFEIGGQ